MKRYQNIIIPLLILVIILQPLPPNSFISNFSDSIKENARSDSGIKEDIPPTQMFKITQGGSYPGIPVEYSHSQIIQFIGSNWYNTSYRYRVAVWVNESNGISRDNMLVNLKLSFEYGEAYNQSIRLILNSSNTVVPFQVWNETFYVGTQYYQSIALSWIVNLEAYEKKLYYVYWSDYFVGKYPTFPSVLSLTTNNEVYTVSTNNYDVVYTMGKGITLRIDNEDILRPYALAPTPFTVHPYNATYVLLDTGTDNNADYIKVIAWESGTYVKFYGYNSTSGSWVLLKEAILEKKCWA